LAVPKTTFTATLLAMEQVAEQTHRMRLLAPPFAQDAHAGHFVNVLIPQAGNLLWRRPFSIHQVDRSQGTIDLLLASVGKGSRALSRLTIGAQLDLLGLLGNTFAYPDDLQEAVIVAGGVGIAPFLLMMQDLQQRSIAKTVFYGAGNLHRLCCLPEFITYGADLHIATEDGSSGTKGYVTDLFYHYIKNKPAPGRMIYACGPTPMMVRVQDIAAELGLKGQVTV